MKAVNYTYFQTFIRIPETAPLPYVEITFEGLDDGTRATVFNDRYPAGIVDEGSYVTLKNTATGDLSEFMAPGINRIVVTHVDACKNDSRLDSAQILIGGAPAPAGNPDAGTSARVDNPVANTPPPPADQSNARPNGSPAQIAENESEDGIFRIERNVPYPSPDGACQLVFQDDGNLVVYTADQGYVWGLNETSASFGAIAEIGMQPQGYLVAVDKGGNLIWNAPAEGEGVPGSILTIVDDCVLAIQKPDGGFTWRHKPEPVSELNDTPQQTKAGTNPIDLPPEPVMAIYLRAYSVNDEVRETAELSDTDFFVTSNEGAAWIGGPGYAAKLELYVLGEDTVVFRALDFGFLTAHEDGATFTENATEASVLKVRNPWEVSELPVRLASFESAVYPGQFLRHQNYALTLDPINADSSSLDRRDATFDLFSEQ